MKYLKSFTKFCVYGLTGILVFLISIVWIAFLQASLVNPIVVTLTSCLLSIALLLVSFWCRELIRYFIDRYYEQRDLNRIAARIGVKRLDTVKPVVDTNPKSEWAYG